jgi:predicted ATP-dependent serine protease
MAKATGIAVVIIGHVTKSGDLAGPRTVEHMVSATDTTAATATAAAAVASTIAAYSSCRCTNCL